jgi:AcrR family transcriptional regulator
MGGKGVVRKEVNVRREEVLDAVITEVERRGIATVRVVDIAKAMGVSKTLIFYHFGTKEELVSAAFAHAAERDFAAMKEVCERRTDPVTRLVTALRLFGPAGKSPGWLLWIDGWSAALREPELAKLIEGMDNRWTNAIAALIQEAVDDGLAICDDPAHAAWHITTLLTGASVQLVVHGRPPRRSMRRIIDEFLTRDLQVTNAKQAAA